MATSRTAMPCPGTLVAKRSEIPSSGWMRITSELGSLVAPRVSLKRPCGRGLKWIATSATRLASRFPARR